MGTSTSRPSSPSGPSSSRALLWLALLAVGIAGLLVWATRSPLFRMRNLEVTGTVRLSAERVASLGDLDDRTNVYWIDLEWVETRIEHDPWVEDARVRRSLPGTVHVLVVERSAVATVRAGDGRPGWWLVATDGTVLEQVVPAPAGLPVVVGPPSGGASLQAGASPAWLRGAAEAAASLSPSPRLDVDSIRVRQQGELVLRLTGGGTVFLGPAEELGDKAAALAAVLDWAAAEGARLATIDVRSPRAPAALTVAEVAASDRASPAEEPGGTSQEDPAENAEATG